MPSITKGSQSRCLELGTGSEPCPLPGAEEPHYNSQHSRRSAQSRLASSHCAIRHGAHPGDRPWGSNRTLAAWALPGTCCTPPPGACRGLCKPPSRALQMRRHSRHGSCRDTDVQAWLRPTLPRELLHPQTRRSRFREWRGLALWMVDPFFFGLFSPSSYESWEVQKER